MVELSADCVCSDDRRNGSCVGKIVRNLSPIILGLCGNFDFEL